MLLILAGFLSIPYFRSIRERELGFERVHLVSEDALEVLNKRGPLDDIGREWAAYPVGNYSNETELRAGVVKGASQIAKDFLDPIVPRHMGYALLIGDSVIYSSDWDATVTDRPDESNATQETRAVRMVSGYQENESESGWVARAWLNYNRTGDIDTLLYEGDNRTNFTIVWGSTWGDRAVAYLIVPMAVNLYNASMNLTWVRF